MSGNDRWKTNVLSSLRKDEIYSICRVNVTRQICSRYVAQQSRRLCHWQLTVWHFSTMEQWSYCRETARSTVRIILLRLTVYV